MPLKEHYNDKFILITEEVEICKRLSSNDVKVRKKGLAALKHLLKNIDNKEVVDVDDYNRIWNGIFNYVWMSDKLLVQEEDVELISKLIHCIKTHDSAMLFVKGFFNSLASRWDRISHYRTDKFLMFVRRFLRQTLFLLKNSQWDSNKIESYSKELYAAIQILPLSLVLHLNDIYNEEIAKVSDGNIPTSALVLLLRGYVECIVNMKPSMNVVNNINSCIFSALARQLKLSIKQKAILTAEPEDKVAQMKNIDCETNENIALDPRPGNVDVYLPYIEFDENVVADFLEEYYSRPHISVKVKNILSQMIKMFRRITNLRQFVTNPINISREGTENKRKRKQKHQTMASLIKKSCKRLKLDETEFEHKQNEKILKKLEKMSDIMQVPVGQKKYAIVQKEKQQDKKLKRKCASSNSEKWTVTDNTDGKSECALLNNSQDWVITKMTEETPKEKINRSCDTSVISNSSMNDSQHLKLINNETKAVKVGDSDTQHSAVVCISLTENTDNSEGDKITKMKKTPTRNDKNNELENTSAVGQGKKQRRVSFNLEHSSITYEPQNVVVNEKCKNNKSVDTIPEIVVPSSAIKNRPGLLKTDENYIVVDFNVASNTNDTIELKSEKIKDNFKFPDKTDDKRKILTSDSSSWTTVSKDEITKCVPQIEDDDDYNLSALFQSPPQSLKRGRRSVRKSLVLEVKRSERIANRTAAAKLQDNKKVSFTGKNNSQEVHEHLKTIQSRPELPFDASKKPIKSILKPFAVPSPINPFYYPNGERKLKKRKVRDVNFNSCKYY